MHAERDAKSGWCARETLKNISGAERAGIKDSFSNMGGWHIFFPIGYKLYVNTREPGAQNPAALPTPFAANTFSALSLRSYLSLFYYAGARLLFEN
jgi:hypothetical protein